MSHTKPELIKSFLPIFYVSKIFGCNLYSLPSPLNATTINAPISAVDVVFCVIQFALYIFVVYPLTSKWNNYNTSFNNEFATQSGSSGLVVIVFIGKSLGNVVTFTNLMITILDMRNSTIIRKMLFSFIKFDEKMLALGMKVQFSHRAMSLSYGLINLCWQILIIFLSLQISKGISDFSVIFIVGTYIGHAIPAGCIYSYLTTFWYILSNLAERFALLNECLRNHLKKIGTDKRDSNLEGHAIVRNLSDQHRKLVDSVSELSKSNALQFIFCTAVTFSSLIVTTFMTYQVLTSRVKEENSTNGLFYSVKSIYYGFLIYKAASVGSKLRKQRNIALSLINKAIVLEQNQSLSTQLNHFSYQVEHSNMTVSCGLFTIDWTLTYTLITALTTYWLLFLQFNSIATQNQKFQ